MSATSAEREARQTACEVNSEFAAALMGDLGRAVGDRRAAFDPDRARRCLEQIRTVSCSVRVDVVRHDTTSPDCAAAVRGLIDANGACNSSWDCVAGSFCDGPPGGQRCSSRHPDAAECTRDDQCATGSCQQGRCSATHPAQCL